MSGPLKKAFSDFSNSPVVARSLFAEVGDTPAEDLYYVLDYDGDYTTSRNHAIISGVSDGKAPDLTKLADVQNSSPEDAFEALKDLWLTFVDDENPDTAEEMRKGLTPEAVVLERSSARENRFRLLTPEDF
jgi:proteasome alpha subunit